jgi:hypothetical protein
MVYQAMGFALYRIALRGLNVRQSKHERRRVGRWSAVAGCHLDGMVEGHAVEGLVKLAFATEAGEEAADGFAGEASHAAELFMGELHEEGEGEISVEGAVAGLVWASEVKESAGQFAGGRGVEGEPACGEDGPVVFAGEGLGDALADVGIAGHEVKEVSAWDGLDDAGFEGFGGNAIGCSLEEGGKSEEVARAGDAEEEKSAFSGRGDDFHAARADNQEIVRGEAFAKEDAVRCEGAAGANGVEVTQDDIRRDRSVRNWDTSSKDEKPP